MPIITDMCSNNDIVLLQETLLLPHDLNLLNKVHPDFNSYSISSVDVGAGVLVGRPYGGLSVLWRNSLSPVCDVVLFDDNRLLGITYTLNNFKILIINVYLPYFTPENVEEYIMYMGKISEIVESCDANGVVIFGDFNADVNNEFYTDLVGLCNDNELIISDVAMLPHGSYTHVNNGTLARTWPDHCVCSQSLHERIASIAIDYNDHASDHLPMQLTLNLNLPQLDINVDNFTPGIRWRFHDARLLNLFYEEVRRGLSQMALCDAFHCNRLCGICIHKAQLTDHWSLFTQILRSAGRRVFGVATEKQFVVPGWNEHVKDLYQVSRQAFLTWRSVGSPRFGALAQHMRRARADFKFALRQCRANEAAHRAQALARKLQSGRVVSFWRDIRAASHHPERLPQRVDQVTGEAQVAQLWQGRYEHVFNSVQDAESKQLFERNLHEADDVPVEPVTPMEVKNIVGQLAGNKSSGKDKIPSEIFKYAPMHLLTWLSLFFTSFLVHSFLPSQMTDVILVPLLKSKMKDPGNSTNYRPIALATTSSKIFENILLNRLSRFLDTSDNQFGFKRHHSTEMCILILKEVISYYLHLNTPIFLCFIDIKSAFDRVSYWLLLNKLLTRGVPMYLLLILQYWFSHQCLYVRWGTTLSASFNMSNGIRQGSVLSPLLFSVYVNELNLLLSQSMVGCHVANKAVNNFSYADDLAIVCPSASALNDMLSICGKFAERHFIEFSTTKSVCMNIVPIGCARFKPPSVYLCGTVLEYVSEFTYLGHVITGDFKDDNDIINQTRKLSARGNALIRQFNVCNKDTKRVLFVTYCYSVYCASLWNNFRHATLNRLKVTYNNIMRRLAGVPPWHSARTMFVHSGVQSFAERLRWLCYGARQRVLESRNELLIVMRDSDARLWSPLWQRWSQLLYRPPLP